MAQLLRSDLFVGLCIAHYTCRGHCRLEQWIGSVHKEPLKFVRVLACAYVCVCVCLHLCVHAHGITLTQQALSRGVSEASPTRCQSLQLLQVRMKGTQAPDAHHGFGK